MNQTETNLDIEIAAISASVTRRSIVQDVNVKEMVAIKQGKSYDAYYGLTKSEWIEVWREFERVGGNLEPLPN